MAIYTDKKDNKKHRIVVHHENAPKGRVDRMFTGTKTAAKRLEAEIRAKLDEGKPQPQRVAPTFSDFCINEYQPHAKVHLKPNTWANRRYDLATLIEWFGDVRLSQIDTRAVEHYKHERLKQVDRRATNNEIMALSAVLRYARDLAVTSAKPKISKLKTRKDRRNAESWSSEEMERLFVAINEEAPAIALMVLFIANTGCRKGEALALQKEQIDIERGLVKIWPYYDEDEDEEFDTKSGQAREVPINDVLEPILRAAARPEAPKWVFGTRKGTRYRAWPARQFNRARNAAGLTGGPHKLRHTYASHFLAHCPDMFLLAKVMGHTHTNVTQLYSHLLPDHLERARNAVRMDLGGVTSPVHQERQSHTLLKHPRAHEWGTISKSAEQLHREVWSKPTRVLAQEFGVSDTAIGKRCRALGVAKPPRGYWRQQESLRD